MLNDYLRRHDGVITVDQARTAGLTWRAIERRLQSGAWIRCSRGVYFVGDRPFSDAARIRSAVWGYGPGATASGLTAAWWHALTRFAPDVAEVTVPRDSHGRRHTGTRVRRRSLEDCDVVERRGLRVTSLPLTVVEAAAQRGGGSRLMDNALQRHVDLNSLWHTHLRNKGRTGAPRSRRLLQAASDGSRSVAERLMVKILKGAGITGWKANYRVAGYRVDFGFPGARVALEVDGMAFHVGADAFQIDRERQNAIVLSGWQVLRFTWLDLTEYPDRVAAVIRAAISAR